MRKVVNKASYKVIFMSLISGYVRKKTKQLLDLLLFANLYANANRDKLYLIVKNWKQFKICRVCINSIPVMDRPNPYKSDSQKSGNSRVF